MDEFYWMKIPRTDTVLLAILFDHMTFHVGNCTGAANPLIGNNRNMYEYSLKTATSETDC